MIKINLLDSVTDRPRGGVAVVEEKVANPRAQTLLMAMVVATLLALGMGYDLISARAKRDAAQSELEIQKRINDQMNAVNKERADLENKTKDIQVRIDAIQKLRASQQGPSAVLRAIKERFDATPDLYLESIAQKGNDLEIKGASPNETAITRFGQSLEFSSGLFTNLHIETQRQALSDAKFSAAEADDPGELKPEVVSFTIKCSYTQSGPASQAAPATRAAVLSDGPAGTHLARK